VRVIGFGLVLSSVALDRLVRRPATRITAARAIATPSPCERAGMSHARQAGRIIHVLGRKAS